MYTICIAKITFIIVLASCKWGFDRRNSIFIPLVEAPQSLNHPKLYVLILSLAHFHPVKKCLE